MELKQGYKSSDSGAIPTDWEHCSIVSVCDYIVPGRNKPKLFDGPIPWITIPDLVDGRAISVSKSGLGISREEARASGSKIVPANSVIMSCIGDLGVVAVCTQDIVINQQLHAFLPGNTVNRRYLMYAIQNKKSYLDGVATKTTVAYLNKESCNSIPIPLPRLIEQEAIAEALSDADTLIESLEKLITKKRNLKHGAMQELLTGKRRLPGFSGKWQRRIWGEVIESCSSGGTPYRGRPDFYKGTVRWITSGELNYNVINDTIEHISEEAVSSSNLKLHPPGTFLMAITGLEAAGTRGSCGIVGRPSTTNQSCMAVYPKPELLSDYLFHYYSLMGDALALQYCQGTKQQSYTAKLVRLLPIDLPPTVKEQDHIVHILSAMDEELTALDRKLGKAKQVKQGMMQELLTGRIRLV